MGTSSRDEEFREAYPDLFGHAYRTAFRITGNRAVAQDLAQEALTRAYIHWTRLDHRRVGWILTTTARLAIDRWRKEERRPNPDRDPGPGAVDVAAAERLDLVRALAKLPRRQREVAVLRYLEDWPERDVAAALGCSVGSVKRHAVRALAALRAELASPTLATEAL
jgi:RNA polymerase sigma-70 factor (sigma-E family)